MSALLSIAPAPGDLGLDPDRFPSWRSTQVKAIDDGIASDKRFVAQMLSTGTGKTASNGAQGAIAGRFVYLTFTRALQKQALRDLGPLNVVDIRGRSNYDCVYGASQSTTCDDGFHLGCKAHKEGACPYVQALTHAKDPANNPVTNYAYWMAVNKYGEGLGPVDAVICDEAGQAVDAVCDMLTIEIGQRDLVMLKRLGHAPPPSADLAIEQWKEWAAAGGKLAEARVKQIEEAIRKLKQAVRPSTGEEADTPATLPSVPPDVLDDLKGHRRLSGILGELAEVKGKWVADSTYDSSGGAGEGGGRTRTGYRFDPLWPGAYTEELLFCGAPKILLTSATLNRKTLDLLGVPREECTYREYPAVFDPARSPIVHIRTTRVDSRIDHDGLATLVTRIDQIIRHEAPAKGIIHCVSYPRMKDIYRLSGERGKLIWHASYNTQDKIDLFKGKPADSGAVLLSPAIATGYDFPDDEARFIIIAKCPMVDSRSRIMQARLREDPDYGDYLAAQTFVQMPGRAMRSEKDWVHVYVVDDHFGWWFWKLKKKGLFPAYFPRMVQPAQEALPSRERQRKYA